MIKILPFLLVIAFSCKNAESNQSSTISIDEIVRSQLGDKYEQKDRGDHTLCYTIDKSSNKQKTVVVLNSKTGKVVYGPTKLTADISWHSDTELKIKEYPEVIQDKNSTDTFTYYYDIIQQKKVSEKF